MGNVSPWFSMNAKDDYFTCMNCAESVRGCDVVLRLDNDEEDPSIVHGYFIHTYCADKEAMLQDEQGALQAEPEE